MMMRMLMAGGVPGFYEPRADADNPGGYFESVPVMAGDLAQVPDGHAVKCLHMLPTCDPALDVRVIIMRRHLPVSLASANRVGGGYGAPALPEGYDAFLTQCMDAIRLWCAGKPHIEVWKDDVHRNTPGECLRVRRMLGLDLDLAAMAGVPEPRSY
jgi:hypothetical protein